MRIGFIGGWGHHYLRGLATNPPEGLQLTLAVAPDGLDPAPAAKVASSLPQARWFDDPLAMLDQFKPDALSVGAVYAHNGRWAEEGIKRDIPVVSDKPVAATWGQLHRLRELTAGTQRVLLTEFDFRSRPCFRAARDAVKAGLIGDVVLATAQKSYRFGSRPPWYADRSLYAGTLLWIASHGIDAIRFTTGQRFRDVSGRQGNLSRPDFGAMEDHCVSVLELDGGGTAVVHADFLRPAAASTHGDDRLRLAGSKGLVEIRGDRCCLTTHDAPERDITDQAAALPIARELLAALRGECREYYSTEASLEMAAVLLAARDAADRRQRIEL